MQGLRDRKRADNRLTTIDAAYELFAERGYDVVTVADICATAGIARRTFFRYFDSKVAVLDEPLQQMTDRVVSSIAASDCADDGQVLRAALTESARYVLAHRERLTLHHRIVAASTTLAWSPYRQLGGHEWSHAKQLDERRGQLGDPDWRTRLLVSRGVSVLRVWLDETLRAPLSGDTSELLDEMFDADPWFATASQERSSP
ncbi:MAG: TetR family transcriptional regulator [Mycobacteriales bacterium]